MARVQFDLQVRGTVTDAEGDALERWVTSFRDACLEKGLEVRGHGLEVVRDPVTAETPVTGVDVSDQVDRTVITEMPSADPPVDPAS